ncbi:hypothetical protein F5Y19DRAFT_42206 [Xylariaceae sp. FL1651]|nr:hypothetical protein F5Y19DRAFT_42206 [Xylariaceae sp. FL1651]
MARRRIIADSEDEDEVDVEYLVMSPLKDNVDRPEPEPLSPHHRPSSPADPKAHNHRYDNTEPSSLIDIHDDQQNLAVQQSNLIEKIVRQSQRASASSGNILLPAKGQERKADLSSGTDVTSPVLSRPQGHTALLSDGASEFTTPRRSRVQEWEVPSSAEAATAPPSTKGSRSKEKVYGKRKRRRSNLMSSSIAAEMFAAEEAEEATVEETDSHIQLHATEEMGLPPMTTAKKRKLSLHESALPNATNFYIAQSELTTMQKLEYQKVNVPTPSYAGLPGSLATNQKSSGATTIAYSTPSGYSSIPPLPWERLPATATQPASSRPNNIINISSSPDVIASGYDISRERNPAVVSIIETAESFESPAKPQVVSPVSKRKKASQKAEETDELGQDDIWDTYDIGLTRESHQPRATKRRSAVAASLLCIESNTGVQEQALEEAETQAQNPSRISIPTLLDTDELEPQPEVPPKKRGRKKKQPAVEEVSEATGTNEDQHLIENYAAISKASETETQIEKPKKKRGRPRKLDPPKADGESLSGPAVVDEPLKAGSPPNDSKLKESAIVAEKQEDGESKVMGKKRKSLEENEDTQSTEDRLPLHEVKSNSRSPSKLCSARESSTKTGTESKDGNLMLKTPSKEIPKVAASQSKVTYRVGLSKRSRIAPLLKFIKK